MLAQMQTVEPGFLHQFLLVVLGLLGGAAAVVGMYAALRKKKIEPQPFEVAEAQRFSTVESCHAAHSEVARRLDGHDTDIRAIYAELKGDRAQNEIHASQRASAGGSATVADRPTRRAPGASAASRARQRARRSPRLVPASACASSITRHASPSKKAGASG